MVGRNQEKLDSLTGRTGGQPMILDENDLLKSVESCVAVLSSLHGQIDGVANWLG